MKPTSLFFSMAVLLCSVWPPAAQAKTPTSQWSALKPLPPRSSEQGARGLLLLFRGPAVTSPKARDRQHARLGLSLHRRFTRLPADAVRPRMAMGTAQLRKLCASYLKDPNVEACVLDVVLHPVAQGHGDRESREENFARPSTCSLIANQEAPRVGFGRLSRRWAQEYIGADLAKELVEVSKATHPVPVAVFEPGSFRADALPQPVPGLPTNQTQDAWHGTSVANLIASRDYGSAAKAVMNQPSLFVSIAENDRVNDASISHLLGALDEQLSSGVRLSNHSYVLSPSHAETFLKYPRSHNHQGLLHPDAPDSALLVIASGSYYPRRPNGTLAFSLASQGAIVVGNLAATGLMAEDSTEGKEVTISAPSDDFLTSRSTPGQDSRFGGGSGATPLVTGAIANALSFVPDLTPNETKTLLRETALPTLASRKKPLLNGAGMVNAYGLARVAERLAQLCPSGTPAERVKCRAEYLARRKNTSEGASLYDFPEASPGAVRHALREADQAFPNCESPTAADCDAQRKVVAQLRQALFLAPHARELATKLACLHRAQELRTNALFYESIAKATDPLLDTATPLRLYDALTTNLPLPFPMNEDLVLAMPVQKINHVLHALDLEKASRPMRKTLAPYALRVAASIKFDEEADIPGELANVIDFLATNSEDKSKWKALRRINKRPTDYPPER